MSVGWPGGSWTPSRRSIMTRGGFNATGTTPGPKLTPWTLATGWHASIPLILQRVLGSNLTGTETRLNSMPMSAMCANRTTFSLNGIETCQSSTSPVWRAGCGMNLRSGRFASSVSCCKVVECSSDFHLQLSTVLIRPRSRLPGPGNGTAAWSMTPPSSTPVALSVASRIQSLASSMKTSSPPALGTRLGPRLCLTLALPLLAKRFPSLPAQLASNMCQTHSIQYLWHPSFLSTIQNSPLR